MTIERTRELLGEKVAHLSDDKVLLLIQQTEASLDAIFQLSINKALAKQKESRRAAASP